MEISSRFDDELTRSLFASTLLMLVLLLKSSTQEWRGETPFFRYYIFGGAAVANSAKQIQHEYFIPLIELSVFPFRDSCLSAATLTATRTFAQI